MACLTCLNPDSSTLVPLNTNLKRCSCSRRSDKVSAWLKDCSKNHALCPPAPSAVLPTRLVDVLSREEPFLVETDGGPGSYVALAYCWGPHRFMDLMTFHANSTSIRGSSRPVVPNIESHRDRIPFSSMPKTIQDAVTICRQLGVKFLWIDALCIIQGDDSEWNRESPKIAGIFANAILTIAADSADGVEKGFLDHLTPASCTDDDVNGGIHQCPSPLSWNEPLNRRAWSLAEVIFSNRIVHYTSLEMVWECNETRTWECGHSLAVENDDEDSFRIFRNLSLPNPPTRDDLYCKWTIVIRQFTRRQINSHGRQDRDSARLTALARVARRFSEIMKKLSDVEDEYLAGIWKGDLSRSLLWSVDTDFCSGELGQHQQWRRPQQPRAPSWSWAAVEGPATVQRVSDFQTEVHFETVIVRPANPDDPFGAVTSGELVVRGRVVHNLHVKLQNHDPANNIDAQIWHVHVNIHGESSKFLADVPLDGVKQFHTLSCVYLGNGQIGGSSTEEQQPYHAFLLLQPISGAESTFQRVGISTPSTSCAGISILFDHATEERITIV